VVIPEPSTVTLGLALAGLLTMLRPFRRQA
jgi:hypothetical protein